MSRGVVLSGVLLTLFAAEAPASAQQVQIPGSVLPSHIEERQPPQPQAPGLAPPITVEHEQTAQPPGAEKVVFTLAGVTVEGNQAVPTPALQPLWAGEIGKPVSLAQVYAIADAITVEYRNAGYILARAVVPPQRISNGVVQIRVVEGYIDQVKVTGGTPGGSGLVNAIAAHLTETRPLTSAVLERYLLLLSDLPGVTVQSVVSPSPTTPGAATLAVTLAEKQLSGYASLDNRGSRFVGPLQATVGGQINSLFDRYDATRFEFLTTPADPSELLFGGITHVEPLDSEGTTLSLTANYAKTQPGSRLKYLGIDADSLYLSAMVQHPFIRSRSENLYGRISFDFVDSTTDLGNGAINLYKDRVRPLRLGGTFNILDAVGGTDETTVVLSQGLPILHASQDGGPELSHAAGQSDFTKINLDLSHLQPLPGKFSVLLAASGQYAFNPLLVSEEFGLGGTQYDRAFDPSEMLGDDAIAGKIELRYSDAPGYSYLQTYQLYTYLDAGEVWVLRAPVGDQGHAGAESFGIGARFDLTDNLSGSIEGALPISRKVAAYAPSGGAAPRVFFSVTAHF